MRENKICHKQVALRKCLKNRLDWIILCFCFVLLLCILYSGIEYKWEHLNIPNGTHIENKYHHKCTHTHTVHRYNKHLKIHANIVLASERPNHQPTNERTFTQSPWVSDTTTLRSVAIYDNPIITISTFQITSNSKQRLNKTKQNNAKNNLQGLHPFRSFYSISRGTL